MRDLLLPAPLVFQVGQDVARERMAGEFPFPVMLHGNSPTVPELHDVEGFRHECAHHLHARPRLHDPQFGSFQAFFQEEVYVRAMDFRYITPEMIVPGAAAPAEQGIPLLGNDDFCAQFTRPDGSHQARNAAAHAQDIRLNQLLF